MKLVALWPTQAAYATVQEGETSGGATLRDVEHLMAAPFAEGAGRFHVRRSIDEPQTAKWALIVERGDKR